MNHLLYAKFCMLLTFLFAGLNLHQFLNSYGYVVGKIKEFREFLNTEQPGNGTTWLNILFYLGVPLLYLIALNKAEFFAIGLAILSFKFLLSAALGFWMQNLVYRNLDYTKKMHLIGKADNILNIAFSTGVGYLLIFPI